MAKGTVNKVTLVGRLGQDPEIRFTGEGNAIASFSVATNESWKSKDGTMQERTEWTKVTVFGTTAEKYVQPYIKKGTLVYVEGSLKTDKWQDKDGNDKYSTGVVANIYGGSSNFRGRRIKYGLFFINEPRKTRKRELKSSS